MHLVDGTYELFRSYFGAPSAKNAAGAEVGATRGLLRSLAKLLRDDAVTHVACAFDHVIESFRNELFAGYKTGAGLDPDLLSQFSLAERASHALGMVTWPMIEFEADDAIATAAARFCDDPRVAQVVICSPDKDMAQCVRGTCVVCVDRLRGRTLDEAGVVAKFGVPPASIPDYLALVGDTADGVPGIPGWGARSAATLLARHGRLEGIPAESAHWDVTVRSAARLADTLRARAEEALFYRRLTTLRTDVPMSESLEDLEWQGARREELEALCAELDDPDFVSSIARFRS